MQGLGALWCSNYGDNNGVGAPRALYASEGGDHHPGWDYPLGDRKPDLLQFGSRGTVAGRPDVDINAYRGTRAQLESIFTGKKTTSEKGPLMALSDQEQRELLEKTRTIHHELTHRFQTRVRNQDGDLEPYRDTLVGYMLETDRKVEDMHKNMLPSIWRKLTSKLGKGEK